MSDEQPVNLKALETAEPGVVKGAMRQFRRRMFIRGVWVLILLLAGAAILASHRQDVAHTSFGGTEAGAFDNLAMGNYKVGQIDVAVLKVQRLPGGRWGLVIVLHRVQPFDDSCCALYPTDGRVGVETMPAEVAGSNFEQDFVEAPMSAGTTFTFTVGPPQRSLGTFTVDLHTLDLTGGA